MTTEPNERTEGWSIIDPRLPAHYFRDERPLCGRLAEYDKVGELADAGRWPVEHCADCVKAFNEWVDKLHTVRSQNGNGGA